MLTMKVNTEAHFWTVRAFVPDMVARNRGHVVTIASAAGISGTTGLADYCASKFAAFGFDEALRLEFKSKGKDGCNTTCVCPFFIDTGMFDGCRSRFSFLLPILKPDYVADRIVIGILENQNYVLLPDLVWIVFLVRFLCPTWLQDRVAQFLGLTTAMDHFVGRRG
eukprot:TRINITY_DN3925_c0_g1_i12.p1 TRINITY_DN3925_c0_g1~~TRINITY_DN3925_c0_g1_i12.p1  ORF type:complete len:166 (+),score=32.65 TRINITY_DN3925_c0_g1_i12:460-957(+)